jgi:hypothetical protein
MNNINDKKNDVSKNSVGRKKDKIRDYIIIKNDKKYCTISNCEKVFSIDTSVSSLKFHLEKTPS